MGRLDGVRAVITGGASGIGEATAPLSAAGGAAVVIADIDDDRSRQIAAELGQHCHFDGGLLTGPLHRQQEPALLGLLALLRRSPPPASSP